MKRLFPLVLAGALLAACGAPAPDSTPRFEEAIYRAEDRAQFAKVVESQRAWAKSVCQYWFLNDAPFKMGYEHVFKVKIPD